VSPRLDWEIELVAVIGRTGRNIDEDKAWSFVAGLMIGQDLSARDVQLAGSAPQWSLGKSFSGFGPVGPWMTSARDCPNRDDLLIECELNGKRMQSDRTSNMIWSVSELVARLSWVCELRAGDLIFTGTPAGIGNRRTPPIYIRSGDRLVSRIEGLGEMAA
ncbi:fumarylacetoacetate (FAA) hydrolase family protein, partial [mine drainage metagenome]